MAESTPPPTAPPPTSAPAVGEPALPPPAYTPQGGAGRSSYDQNPEPLPSYEPRRFNRLHMLDPRTDHRVDRRIEAGWDDVDYAKGKPKHSVNTWISVLGFAALVAILLGIGFGVLKKDHDRR